MTKDNLKDETANSTNTVLVDGAVNETKIHWTAECKPNMGVSHYDHTISETPLGKFIIEWKSWKENPSYDIQLNGEWIGCEYDLNDAKEKAKEYLANKYNELKLYLGM